MGTSFLMKLKNKTEKLHFSTFFYVSAIKVKMLEIAFWPLIRLYVILYNCAVENEKHFINTLKNELTIFFFFNLCFIFTFLW